MKCQVVAHLFREASLSGEAAEVGCARWEGNKAAVSEHHCMNIFDKLPKGILDKRDLRLEEYIVIFSIINK